MRAPTPPVRYSPIAFRYCGKLFELNIAIMTLTAGTRVGQYEILSPLGAGGMGEVYRAQDLRLDRQVAIKVLPAETMNDPSARRRFEQEARSIAALSHPNILAIHHFDAQQGVAYAVTELLEGETLRE